MNLKTFIKEDGSIIDVYCQKSFNENHKDFLIFNSENKFHGIYYDWNEFLNINKIKECFDARIFTNIKGNCNHCFWNIFDVIFWIINRRKNIV